MLLGGLYHFNIYFSCRFKIAKVEESKASMFGTKLEIVLKKAEAGSWARLGRDMAEGSATTNAVGTAGSNPLGKEQELEDDDTVDALDLDDLELSSGETFSN